MATADVKNTPIPTGTWNVDPIHSQVGFSVKHMGVATVRGTFGEYEGTAEAGADLEHTKIYGKVKTASVNTAFPQRDDHLRSPDFFDSEQFPDITFESTKIEEIDEDTFRVIGNLSMHGVTKEIAFEAIVDGTDIDPQGNERLGVELLGQISRGDFEMKFDAALGSGNAVVSDKVKLALDISAVKQA
jgi:polyisoprenoid-binding protein YceI